MPLPSLKQYRVADANAREFQKRVLLGAEPAQAAHEVGGVASQLAANPAAQQLAKAVEPTELALMQDSPRPWARGALESREGRREWLEGVALGLVKFEGAFGNMKQFPPAARIAAAALLGKMQGDFVHKVDVTVNEQRVFVFKIPDNGRVPQKLVVDAQAEE